MICCRCKHDKTESEMRKDKGRYYVCKDCHNARRRERYAADPAKVLEKNKEWASKNRGKLNEYCFEWRRREGTNKSTLRRRKEIDTLGDAYVRQIIIGRSQLSHRDIPQEMVEAHRLVLMIKRMANEKRA